MNVLAEHVPARDDTERSLGIARRGQPRTPNSAASEEMQASVSLWLGLILFAAVAARLLVFALGPVSDIERAMDPASHLDLRLSLTLAEHGVFATESSSGGDAIVLEPYAGAPGYATLLAGAQWLGVPLEALLMLQIAMGAVAAVLVYGITFALLKQPRPALVAAAVTALHPVGLVAANTLTPDTLFVTLLLLGVWLAAAQRYHDFAGSLLGGLAIGLAVLVRPLSLLMGAAMAVWMLLSDRRLMGVAAAAVLTFASLTPPAVWAYRNHMAELPYWPTSLKDEAAQMAAAAANPADLLPRAGERFTAHDVPGLYARLGLAAPTGLHPAPLADPSGMRRFLESPEPATWLALAWSGVNALLMIAALVGLVLLVVRRQWSPVFLLGGLLIYALLSPSAGAPGLGVLGLQATAAAAVLMKVPRRERQPRRWFRRRDRMEADEPDEPMPIMTGRPL